MYALLPLAIFGIVKNNTNDNDGCAAVVAAGDTGSSAARGKRSISYGFVTGTQPYDNNQCDSNSARFVLYDTVHSRNGVGVGKPFVCSRRNKASGCLYPSQILKIRSLRINPNKFVRATKQMRVTCHVTRYDDSFDRRATEGLDLQRRG